MKEKGIKFTIQSSETWKDLAWVGKKQTRSEQKDEILENKLDYVDLESLAR